MKQPLECSENQAVSVKDLATSVVDLPEPPEADCVECEERFPEPLQPSYGEKARAQSSWKNKDVVLKFPLDSMLSSLISATCSVNH